MEDKKLQNLVRGKQASGKARTMSLRSLLATIGQKRRGKHVLNELRAFLRKEGIHIQPSLGQVAIDDEITLSLAVSSTSDGDKEESIERSNQSSFSFDTTKKLEGLAQEIQASLKRSRQLSLRELLAVVGQERRGRLVVAALKSWLHDANLRIEPDIDNAYIDEKLTIFVAGTDTALSFSKTDQKEVSTDHSPSLPKVSPIFEKSDEQREVVITVRQGLKQGRDDKPPLVFRGNKRIEEALTELIAADSECAIVSGSERGRIEGVFTWESYGKRIVSGKLCDEVKHCVSADFRELNEEKPFFDLVREVIHHRYVVVRARDSTFWRLVTSRDAADSLIEQAEPYLFLGQIENHLRALLERADLQTDGLRELVDPRDENRKASIRSIDQLNLGELLTAFAKDVIWQNIGVKLDRKFLHKRLEEVRQIRNKIMHFHPDGIRDEDKKILQDTRRILQKL